MGPKGKGCQESGMEPATGSSSRGNWSVNWSGHQEVVGDLGEHGSVEHAAGAGMNVQHQQGRGRGSTDHFQAEGL